MTASIFALWRPGFGFPCRRGGQITHLICNRPIALWVVVAMDRLSFHSPPFFLMDLQHFTSSVFIICFFFLGSWQCHVGIFQQQCLLQHVRNCHKDPIGMVSQTFITLNAKMGLLRFHEDLMDIGHDVIRGA